MTHLNIITSLDEARFEAINKATTETHIHHIQAQGAGQVEIGRLPHAMQSGKATIAVCTTLENGDIVVIEMSEDHFNAAAAAFKARAEMERGQGPGCAGCKGH